MSKTVWVDSLAGEGWNLLGGCGHVLLQLEANARRAQGGPVAVHEDVFILSARLSFQKGLEQLDRLGPQRTDSFLAPLAE